MFTPLHNYYATYTTRKLSKAYCFHFKSVLRFISILVLIILTGCGKTFEDHNIIIISLDTLRPDRLGCYGYERPTSPYIDKLAAQGVLFRNARAQSSWTLPSHMSLFTSLYPSFHQVMNTDHSLSPHIPTLAQLLKKDGFVTAAFTEGGNLFRIYGFGKGFDRYGERSKSIETTFSQAIKWLSSEPAKGKFFLFIHTYENHTPYLRNTLADPHKRGRMGDTLPVNQQLFDILYGRFSLTNQEKEYVNNLYDSGVLYADSYIQKLMESLKQLGLLENTTVIILSDHGEDLWDHGISPAHGATLYEEQLRIPLIIYDHTLPPNAEIDTPVQLIDVMPTLLAMHKIPIPSHLQGKNLLPLIYSQKTPNGSALFSEGTDYGPQRIAVIKGNYKYIAILNAQKVKRGLTMETLAPLEPGLAKRALFDLKKDPLEKNNLIFKYPEKARELHTILEKEYLEKSRSLNPHTLTFSLTEQEKERLTRLGYLD